MELLLALLAVFLILAVVAWLYGRYHTPLHEPAAEVEAPAPSDEEFLEGVILEALGASDGGWASPLWFIGLGRLGSVESSATEVPDFKVAHFVAARRRRR